MLTTDVISFEQPGPELLQVDYIMNKHSIIILQLFLISVDLELVLTFAFSGTRGIIF